MMIFPYHSSNYNNLLTIKIIVVRDLKNKIPNVTRANDKKREGVQNNMSSLT